MRATSIFAALSLTACGASTHEAQPERTTATLGTGAPTFARHGCTRIDDSSVPAATVFSAPVPFDVGHTDTHPGDSLQITEVRGTQPGFGVGGMYLVRGTYTLASAEEASLEVHVTATRAGEGCTGNAPRERVAIHRGTGTFELATRIAYEGHPHVSYYMTGSSAGGVYFGRDAFLRP